MSGRLDWPQPRRLLALAMAVVVPLTVLRSGPPAPDAAGPEVASAWAAANWLTSTAGGAGTSLANVRTIIGAGTGAAAKLTGKGVGIALIDTGVAPVAGLPKAQIVNGPDLSFESQAAGLRYLDTFGHGTHMAGIIVANDPSTGTLGIAPEAKLTSVKVGSATGAVDISQVMAAIDWVVKHRNDDPANPIKIINLSYSAGGESSYNNDVLHFAAEQAWRNGVTVIAAAGNNGNSAGKLTNPATDAFLVAVGAAATNGTVSTADDDVATFCNLGSTRNVDVLAPGESVTSLRDPGSYIDNTYPAARTGDTLFRGSGTSQATAVTSAAAALILQARPTLRPDQLKDLLKRGTVLLNGNAKKAGLRMINVGTALGLTPATTAQSAAWSSANGLINLSRGANTVSVDGVLLSGEVTVFGPFNGLQWSTASAQQTAWSGGSWVGVKIAGDGWGGTSFASRTWAAATWTQSPWGGGSTSWFDPSWSGRFWASTGWSSGSWSGRFWASGGWSGTTWG